MHRRYDLRSKKRPKMPQKLENKENLQCLKDKNMNDDECVTFVDISLKPEVSSLTTANQNKLSGCNSIVIEHENVGVEVQSSVIDTERSYQVNNMTDDQNVYLSPSFDVIKLTQSNISNISPSVSVSISKPEMLEHVTTKVVDILGESVISEQLTLSESVFIDKSLKILENNSKTSTNLASDSHTSRDFIECSQPHEVSSENMYVAPASSTEVSNKNNSDTSTNLASDSHTSRDFIECSQPHEVSSENVYVAPASSTEASNKNNSETSTNLASDSYTSREFIEFSQPLVVSSENVYVAPASSTEVTNKINSETSTNLVLDSHRDLIECSQLHVISSENVYVAPASSTEFTNKTTSPVIVHNNGISGTEECDQANMTVVQNVPLSPSFEIEKLTESSIKDLNIVEEYDVILEQLTLSESVIIDKSLEILKNNSETSTNLASDSHTSIDSIECSQQRTVTVICSENVYVSPASSTEVTTKITSPVLVNNNGINNNNKQYETNCANKHQKNIIISPSVLDTFSEPEILEQVSIENLNLFGDNMLLRHPISSLPVIIDDSLELQNNNSETILAPESSRSINFIECSPPRLINPGNFYVPSSSPETLTPVLKDTEQPSTSNKPETTTERISINQLEQLQHDLSISDDEVADPDWKNPEEENNAGVDDDDDDNDQESEPPCKKAKKIKTARWHKRNEATYHRNEQKVLRSKCMPYRNYKKQLKSPKTPKIMECLCRLKCSEKFTPEEQTEICKSYWGLQDYKRQKDFILSNVTSHVPERRLMAAKRPRNVARLYHFQKNNTKIRVCEKFFKATLSISNGPINKAFSGIGISGSYEKDDLRGKHEPPNKTSKEDEDYVKKHIDSFPTMESHYCRKTSSKRYLENNLSISKMHELYESKCEQDGRPPVSVNVYRRIFSTEFNLDFHKTKKDQCLTCHKYQTAKVEKSTDLNIWQKKYDEHINLKNQSQAAKEHDKERANNDETFNSITMDLQKVLHLPNSNVSLLYYLRKINVYNATIYEARSPNDGYCYIWNELNGKKGSDEVGTALYLWITTRLPEKVKEVSIFTDTCAGQNRNQFLLCLLLYLVQNTHLEVIEQKYLESGHSHMEVDSMHSAIENQMKTMPVFSMNDYCNVIRMARSNRKTKKGVAKKKPYEPIIMEFTDILDLKDMKNNLLNNRLIGSDGNKIQWLKVKCFRFEKKNPDVVLYRYDFESDYKELNVSKKGKRVRGKNLRKSSKPCETEETFETYALKKAYTSLLPITTLKKKDLMKMCAEKIIPAELHHWYQNLPQVQGPDFVPDEDDEVEDIYAMISHD